MLGWVGWTWSESHDMFSGLSDKNIKATLFSQAYKKQAPKPKFKVPSFFVGTE